jgi:hypothetical protein
VRASGLAISSMEKAVCGGCGTELTIRLLSSLATLLILGVTLFAATNLDDIFVLLGFFADPQFRTRYIIVGQCLEAWACSFWSV